MCMWTCLEISSYRVLIWKSHQFAHSHDSGYSFRLPVQDIPQHASPPHVRVHSLSSPQCLRRNPRSQISFTDGLRIPTQIILTIRHHTHRRFRQISPGEKRTESQLATFSLFTADARRKLGARLDLVRITIRKSVIDADILTSILEMAGTARDDEFDFGVSCLRGCRCTHIGSDLRALLPTLPKPSLTPPRPVPSASILHHHPRGTAKMSQCTTRGL